MEGSAETTEGLGAYRLSLIEAGLRLGQIGAKARWTPRSLVRGNKKDRCFIEGGSRRLG